ncbi:MAG: SET domain-containing protein-lysine N-methyltransferase [Phycisphaeraceae bacterium]
MPDAIIAEGNPLIRVKPSPIHGQGLFAATRIEAETYIGEYLGPRTQTDGLYVLWIEEEDGTLYGIDGQNDLRYLNHSLEPNAELEGEELYALRDIELGEEITIHYGPDWEEEEEEEYDEEDLDEEVDELDEVEALEEAEEIEQPLRLEEEAGRG